MPRIILSVFLLVNTACASLPESSKQNSAGQDDRTAIQETVLDYFQGQGEASRQRLMDAFAEEIAAMVTNVKAENGDETFRRIEIADVISQWASNPNPVGPSSDYEFLSLNIVDDRLATVTFRSRDRFFDALILMKQNEKWHIVSKVYVPQ